MSENLMDNLLKRGIAPERIDTIPLGSFRIIRDQNLMPEKSTNPTILFFGRIVPYKGLDILNNAHSGIKYEN
jgi:glycosyltransferase involved in cell wall biosynthesis